MAKWIKQWEVRSSTRDKYYTVSIDRNGEYGCSCPRWIFRREQCRHITEVKSRELSNPVKPVVAIKPSFKLTTVSKPTYDKKSNTLLLPVIQLPDTAMMEVTICYCLLKHGYSMSEIRILRDIPDDWSAQAINDFVTRNGVAEYKDEKPHGRKFKVA